MSGGSMNYLYSRIEYDATFALDTPKRRAFKNHLMLVARCLKAIEWNDSGDGDSQEEALLLKCLGQGRVLEAAIEEAQAAVQVLQAEIAKSQKLKPVKENTDDQE